MDDADARLLWQQTGRKPYALYEARQGEPAITLDTPMALVAPVLLQRNLSRWLVNALTLLRRDHGEIPIRAWVVARTPASPVRIPKMGQRTLTALRGELRYLLVHEHIRAMREASDRGDSPPHIETFWDALKQSFSET